MDFHYIVELVLGVAVPIISWLLSSKAKQQEKELDTLQTSILDLYSKHEADSQKLSALETKVAENHPQRDEVRSMVSDLKSYLDSRFSSLENLMRQK
jgi:hypothetical protein